MKKLLLQPEPYKFILGARDTVKAQAAYQGLTFDKENNTISVLPLDLTNLRSVKSFAQQSLAELGPRQLDYLFLNAGTLDSANGSGPYGSQWCEGYVVNHLGERGNEE